MERLRREMAQREADGAERRRHLEHRLNLASAEVERLRVKEDQGQQLFDGARAEAEEVRKELVAAERALHKEKEANGKVKTLKIDYSFFIH